MWSHFLKTNSCVNCANTTSYKHKTSSHEVGPKLNVFWREHSYVATHLISTEHDCYFESERFCKSTSTTRLNRTFQLVDRILRSERLFAQLVQTGLNSIQINIKKTLELRGFTRTRGYGPGRIRISQVRVEYGYGARWARVWPSITTFLSISLPLIQADYFVN